MKAAALFVVVIPCVLLILLVIGVSRLVSKEDQPDAPPVSKTWWRRWSSSLDGLIDDLHETRRDKHHVDYEGRIGGRPIELSFSGEVHQIDIGPSVNQTIRLRFTPPFDLGLYVSSAPRNMPHEVRFPSDNAFAGNFEVLAREETRARTLLPPSIRDALLKLRVYASVVVNDDAVEVGRHHGSPESWPRHIKRAAKLARMLEARRSDIAVAKELKRYLPVWKALASKRGWSFSVTPLRMVGRVEAGQASIAMVLRHRGDRTHRAEHFRYEREARLRFTERLRLGLRVTPQGWIDEAATRLGGQDIKTGDALFDDTFRVVADDADGAEQLLSPAVRGGLLLIHHDLDPVKLDDEGLTLREQNDAANAEEMMKLLPALERLAQAIEDARQGQDDKEQGPYR